MAIMILCRRSSTSSRVQVRRMLFCAISRPEVATPPALAALAGPYRTPASRNSLVASSVLGIDFVLRGAGEGAIGLDVPQRVVAELHVGGHEDGLLVLVGVLADAATAGILQVHDVRQLFAVDAVGIVYHAVGVGHGDRLGAEIE